MIIISSGIDTVSCINDFKFSMIFYDIIVELMNIPEIICKMSNQAISGTSHNNFVRFSAISSFHQCLLQFYKIKTLRYALKIC